MTIRRIYAQKKQGTVVGELHLYGIVGKTWDDDGITAKGVVDAITRLKQDGAKTLNVFINSVGGNAFEGLAIHNAIKRFDGEKVVFVDGLAASAASVIAMAGDRVVMAANALLMIHNPRTFASGEAADLRKVADNLDTLREAMVGTYQARSGQKADDIRAWCDAETWMDAKTAKDRGFCDEITDDADEDESADESAKASAEFRFFAEFNRAPESAQKLLNVVARGVRPPAASRPPERDEAPEEKQKMKLVLAALMLDANATEAEALAKVEALKKFQAEVQAATGQQEPAAALGTVLAYKDAAAKLPEIASKLEQLEFSAREAEVTALIEQGKKDGKLAPAQEAWARGLGASNVASLKAYLESAPQLVAPSAGAVAEPPPGASASLTDEDRIVAKQMCIDEKTFAEAKAAALRA